MLVETSREHGMLIETSITNCILIPELWFSHKGKYYQLRIHEFIDHW